MQAVSEALSEYAASWRSRADSPESMTAAQNSSSAESSPMDDLRTNLHALLYLDVIPCAIYMPDLVCGSASLVLCAQELSQVRAQRV